MNDDQLVSALVQQLHEHTADDAVSYGLSCALEGLPVRPQRRPYLVPVGAAAAVTALATGGVLVAQSPALVGVAAGTASPTPLASSLAPSPVPLASSTAASPAPGVAASASPAGSPSAATSPIPAASTEPLTDPAKRASVSPVPIKPGARTAAGGATASSAPPTSSAAGQPAPTGDTDDRAALASATAYGVTVTTVQDAAHPDAKTVSTEAWQHDNQQLFFAGRTALDWDQLQALPTDLTSFIADVTASGHPPNAVEKGASGLPLEGPMPLQLRKNAVAMLESAPQSTTLTSTHDHLGRPATRVRVDVENILDDYYFDPVSYRLLESGETFTAAWRAAFDTSGGQSPADFTDWYASYGDWTITP